MKRHKIKKLIQKNHQKETKNISDIELHRLKSENIELIKKLNEKDTEIETLKNDLRIEFNKNRKKDKYSSERKLTESLIDDLKIKLLTLSNKTTQIISAIDIPEKDELIAMASVAKEISLQNLITLPSSNLKLLELEALKRLSESEFLKEIILSKDDYIQGYIDGRQTISKLEEPADEELAS
jgi:hypothetical protein